MPALGGGRAKSTVYGMAAVDERGRLANGVVVRELGWSAGTRLAIRATAGVITVSAGNQGAAQVTGRGHIPLPVTVRHGCGVRSGTSSLFLSLAPSHLGDADDENDRSVCQQVFQDSVQLGTVARVAAQCRRVQHELSVGGTLH